MALTRTLLQAIRSCRVAVVNASTANFVAQYMPPPVITNSSVLGADIARAHSGVDQREVHAAVFQRALIGLGKSDSGLTVSFTRTIRGKGAEREVNLHRPRVQQRN